ncbi:hypothetical protein lerEdw1_012927 [Lerista edwardsae]|nr:hypothetical protein lerEdw1_012927 [Lerista edwardsae]
MRRPLGLPVWARGLSGAVALLLVLPPGSLGSNGNTTCANCSVSVVTCKDPEVEHGVQISGFQSLYTYNSSVSFECKIGYFMIGSFVTQCDKNGIWKPNLPICKKRSNGNTTCANCSVCNEPVVENGEKISGFQSLYTYNSTVSFECKIGYFMIGSYMAQCDEHGTWKPELPTCKKIFNNLVGFITVAPHLCGAPLIPTGNVQPLKSEYNSGMSIVAFCNPKYCFPDETIEMAATCQGYNRWNPPVLPCIRR